jgi:transposase
LAEGSIKAIKREAHDLRKQIDLLFHQSQTALDSGNISLFVALHKQFLKATTTSMHFSLMVHSCLQPSEDLQFAADRALDLIAYDFWDHRITRDADSFRNDTEKSDLNSIPSWEDLCPPISEPTFPFLTPRQWDVLAPLIPPLQPNLPYPNPQDLGRGRGRGRPPADPYLLLAAIFWKIAHHARWQDLPVGYPSMFICRRTYRRLFRSGRLLTLYRALYKDLCTRGRLDLPAMVERGCFTISGNKVALHPDVDKTWQMRTALLFMQPAYRMLRHIRYEKDQDRRRRLSQFRLPRMDRLGRVRMPFTKPIHVRPLRPEPEFSFTPPDHLFLLPKFQK